MCVCVLSVCVCVCGHRRRLLSLTELRRSAEIFIRDKYDKKKYMDKVIDIQRLRVNV